MYLVTELRPDHEVWGKSPVSEPRGFILGMKEPGGGFRSRGRSRGPARTGHVPKRSEGCAEAGGSGGRTSGGLDPPHGPRAAAGARLRLCWLGYMVFLCIVKDSKLLVLAVPFSPATLKGQ